MRCRMFGNFWRGDVDIHEEHGDPTDKMYPFAGEIDVSEDGGFTGIVTDAWGNANVIGSLRMNMLEFTKTYITVRPGKRAGTGILYILRGHQINGIHGGWWGMFTQDGEDPPRGQATCSIRPDPNG